MLPIATGEKSMGIVADVLESTFNAFSNMLFVLQITASMWLAISVICLRTLIHRKGLVTQLKHLRDTSAHAHLGDALRD